MKVPVGFSFAGLHSGIKPSRKDLALVVSEAPCAAAGCFTVNRAKAAPVVDAEARLPTDGIRAVVVNSGNANAMTGPSGLADVRTVHAAVASALGVSPEAIVSASTGVIGMRLPAHKIVDSAPSLVAALGPSPLPCAEAIMTTDTRVKMAWRTLRLDGKDVTLSAVCKGSGMIAPQLATMIAVVVTDCDISPGALDTALRAAMEPSFNNLTVDDDMSTNDAVFALANGRAGNARITDPGPALDAFSGALRELCVELAREIAFDGEGATKLLEVTVQGAPAPAVARDLAKAICGSSLVKTAMFGADPNWGRILATVGARAGSQGWDGIQPAAASVNIQGIQVYAREPLPIDAGALRRKLRGPEVKVVVDLHAGDAATTAWGCDLSYDYVKINADYTSLIVPVSGGGVAKDDRLTNYSPAFKVSLLVEALSYISKFAGKRCVIKYGGGPTAKESLKKSFCEDVALLRSVGLRPIVVHGGGAGTPATLEEQNDLVTLLNREGHHAVGVSGRDGALFRVKADALTVHAGFLELLLAQGYVPVISPIGLGERGQGLHLDADVAAAEVARTLGVDKLVYLAEAPGILEGDELLTDLTAEALRTRLEGGALLNGAAKRARAILGALEGGVHQVHVVDGRTPHSIIAELFTDRGVGTLVTGR
jgi:acetylglutamate kinase